ncbi:MAG: diacylglycerol kinase family protein [Candidatus Eremiobacteraeota bacterium]|nr:diacylglycerol kinase family protein [Candidatus Eremiobacteraeota bacterium]
MAASFGYAFEGFAAAWRTQRNLRIHGALTVAVVAAGIILRFGPLSWALVALAIALLVTAELLNTALEAVVDLVSPEEHPLAKRAKDIAAAGVLVASLGAAAAGAIVLWMHLAGR